MNDDPPSRSASGGSTRGVDALARYEVQERIASGGVGVVYRVLDRATGETRALKRINADAAARPMVVEAFEREYHVLASLEHPRIIRVFDYGVDELGPYYTMEFLEGKDMRRAAPLEYREACRYLRDVATSLALLHARRLIHRDLSPSNIRMTPDGHCKLLDFGALTSFGTTPQVIGTPPSVPPEALRNEPLDQRADLYALGALAYWLLTARHAYPARRIDDLPTLWWRAPDAPSSRVPGVPRELDVLVLSLLSADPLARPASAAEVISRLRVIGDLPPEDTTETDRLAQSFLLSPRFTGRTEELRELERYVKRAIEGHGKAVRLEAAAGMGRTRLLEEVGVRAQLQGAAVLRLDASMHRRLFGTIRAIATRLFDAFPEVAQGHAAPFRAALRLLGRDVEIRLPAEKSEPPLSGAQPNEPSAAIEEWFFAVARAKPLVILVDNVEYADNASLGVLARMATLAKEHAVLLVMTERVRRDGDVPLGLKTLRAHSTPLVLAPLEASQTLELMRSTFGDAPNLERFSEWLHGRAAGSPLHTIEIARQLVLKRVIQYSGGIWTLPVNRPDAELPAALEDALAVRIRSLGASARALAECLSLQRHDPSLALCRLLVDGEDERTVLLLLDELARNDVLHTDGDGYRFSSTALREALLSRMDGASKERHHRRLGEAFATLAGEENPRLRIEAGWHFIRGADDLRGADLIASVTHDALTARTLIADLHRLGTPLEAALKVYKRYRRSIYERMPLLAALAHAGYYEERVWGEQYGDEALDVLESMSGLRLARRLRPLFGRFLSLMFGLLVAVVRFYCVPKRERPYSFSKVFMQLFGAVTTLTGAAAVSFDVERSRRVADLLEPFSVLPERLTPVGIYQCCRALQNIGLEHEAQAYETFDALLRRFQNPRYYPTLPADARKLYIAAAHFARAGFAVFRADGTAALESAEALDASGMKLYSMIASQLRFLYYVNRGEFTKAAPHREQVELYAAQVGSIWQVETWEAPALMLVHTTLSDIVASTRVAQRLEAISETVPSLRLHARLSRLALRLVNSDSLPDAEKTTLAVLEAAPPRSFIGWASVYGYVARGANQRGQPERAKDFCDRVLAHMVDDDRDYVSMFLNIEIELAHAEAALGDVPGALARIDRSLARFRNTDHPLVHGLLHEARARIAWNAGEKSQYERSLAEVEQWFRPTGTPALIAKCERLSELRGAATGVSISPPAPRLMPRAEATEAPTLVDGPITRTVTVDP